MTYIADAIVIMKFRNLAVLLSLLLFLPAGCLGTRVTKDFSMSRDFKPQTVAWLAVVNLDPQIQFSQYVEAELLKKGYKVKEGGMVAQLLKKEGLLKQGTLDTQGLSKISEELQVQGVVLCSVLEFSRFRDSYRLSIKCIAPHNGDTLWYAEGAQEGKKGQRSSELLKRIVTSSLSPLPRLR